MNTNKMMVAFEAKRDFDYIFAKLEQVMEFEHDVEIFGDQYLSIILSGTNNSCGLRLDVDEISNYLSGHEFYYHTVHRLLVSLNSDLIEQELQRIKKGLRND